MAVDYVHGKTYCELCLDQIDPFNLNDGYTLCCNERPVGALEARRLQKNEDDWSELDRLKKMPASAEKEAALMQLTLRLDS